MILIAGRFRVPVGVAHGRASRDGGYDRRQPRRRRLHRLCYAEDVLDPGLILVRERWRDRATLAAHGNSAHIGTWRATWAELGIGERALTLFEVDEGEPT